MTKTIPNSSKPVIFSGIQPSGKLNIGGHLGSLANWIKLQDKYDCLFCVVDLHALTVRQDPQELRERTYQLLALYMAAGIDPQRNTIFCQSHVSEHCELAWILSCCAYMGELGRMTQFKDKSSKYGNNINVGLFAYPILMAADILLYSTNLVPVGADQKQHLELARDLALRFNNLYGEIFTVPEVCIAPLGARVMSLLEPTKKMSKSDENDANVINLLDSPDVVVRKMKRAVTDSGAEVRFAADKPGVSNLLTIFAAITGKTIAALEKDYQGAGYGKFKADLAEALNQFLAPIQQRYHELHSDQGALDKILQEGAVKARERAQKQFTKVREVIGLLGIKNS